MLALLGVGATAPALANEEPVAVIDLWADPTVGLVSPKPDEVEELTRRLRNEFAATERFSVVDPATVARALAARKTEPRTCERDCLVSVGRAVGARKVVSGRVVRMMTLLWAVDLRVTDVETGESTGGAGEFKGDYVMLRDLGVRQLVREIASR
jgi:hypothetical protein